MIISSCILRQYEIISLIFNQFLPTISLIFNKPTSHDLLIMCKYASGRTSVVSLYLALNPFIPVQPKTTWLFKWYLSFKRNFLKIFERNILIKIQLTTNIFWIYDSFQSFFQKYIRSRWPLWRRPPSMNEFIQNFFPCTSQAIDHLEQDRLKLISDSASKYLVLQFSCVIL